ncbi:OsmC family protein [Paenibacillus farraposensis]|uniref:OsmC family protein n=1 Tax=Paenibacillus farraposensis TaxID=2807095 RepID=A0ABW4DH86_9BACL|nr:OsmC family protein [Paenibacillus farraposensis]MCC3379684.1 OsmC family protein [Paenibacillus farraposensis]
MMKYLFRLSSNWQGGVMGRGNVRTENYTTSVSLAKEMEGTGTGTNSEELLLGASATCYLISLGYYVEKERLPVVDITMETEGLVVNDAGYRVAQITHRPTIILENGATREQVQLAASLSAQAEKICMIAKAMKGNVEMVIEPNITISQ